MFYAFVMPSDVCIDLYLFILPFFLPSAKLNIPSEGAIMLWLESFLYLVSNVYNPWRLCDLPWRVWLTHFPRTTGSVISLPGWAWTCRLIRLSRVRIRLQLTLIHWGKIENLATFVGGDNPFSIFYTRTKNSSIWSREFHTKHVYTAYVEYLDFKWLPV